MVSWLAVDRVIAIIKKSFLDHGVELHEVTHLILLMTESSVAVTCHDQTALYKSIIIIIIIITAVRYVGDRK